MKRSIFLVLTLVSLIFPACEHKDLCYHHPHTAEFRVCFDWSKADWIQEDWVRVNYERVSDNLPAGMTMVFYPQDFEGEEITIQLPQGGGLVNVPEGTYKVICYNNDSATLHFTGVKAYDTYAGYTGDGSASEDKDGPSSFSTNHSPIVCGDKDQPIKRRPDMISGCNVYYLKVSRTEVRYTSEEREDYLAKDRVVTLYPKRLVARYTYEVSGIRNLNYVAQLYGTITNLSHKIYFGREEIDKTQITVPFWAVTDRKDFIKGEFLTFGHHPENTDPVTLTLYLTLTDKSDHVYPIDVTDQVFNAPDPMDVYLRITSDIVLPEPIPGDGAFQPEVDDWDEEEHEIIM